MADTTTPVGAVEVAASRLDEEVQRLGVTEVAGVHDNGPVTQAVFGPIGGLTIHRPDGGGVHEVGDDPHHWTPVGGQ